MVNEQPLMVCRKCLVGLDYIENLDDPNDIRWIHPSSHERLTPGVADHDPEPIPASNVLEHRYVCDFCFAPDPAWTYPARSFDTDIVVGDTGFGSSEDWAACDDCHTIIETGDRSKLVYRVMRYAPTYRELRGRDRPKMETILHGWFGQFFAARNGDAHQGAPR